MVFQVAAQLFMLACCGVSAAWAGRDGGGGDDGGEKQAHEEPPCWLNGRGIIPRPRASAASEFVAEILCGGRKRRSPSRAAAASGGGGQDGNAGAPASCAASAGLPGRGRPAPMAAPQVPGLCADPRLPRPSAWRPANSGSPATPAKAAGSRACTSTSFARIGRRDQIVLEQRHQDVAEPAAPRATTRHRLGRHGADRQCGAIHEERLAVGDFSQGSAAPPCPGAHASQAAMKARRAVAVWAFAVHGPNLSHISLAQMSCIRRPGRIAKSLPSANRRQLRAARQGLSPPAFLSPATTPCSARRWSRRARCGSCRARISMQRCTRNPPYWHRVEGATDKLWLRRTVAEKLARVNGRIAAAGLELFLFDAWRPREVQAYFHDVWMPRELQRRDPIADGCGLDRGSGTLLGRAVGQCQESPAPHATAAAVDLTLRWKEWRDALWMGSLFDDVTALANRDRFENLDAQKLFLLRPGSARQSPLAALADDGRRLCRSSR